MNDAAPRSAGGATRTLTFVGTATTLLRLGAFTVLTDPNFLRLGQRAYLGKGLWSRRLTDPTMTPADLPPLDAIVLSHLHGDHFDRVARRGLARDQPVLTTPEAARTLVRWGFEAAGLACWESTALNRSGESLHITSLPAVHARGLLGRLLPPVMGTLLEHRCGESTFRVYLTGDTLTGGHIDDIAARYPDVDVAVTHLGGTRVLLHTVTMDAEQGVDFLGRLRPAAVVPVHYDDYRVFRSPLSDFERLTRAQGLGHLLHGVRRGQTIDLDGPERP